MEKRKPASSKRRKRKPVAQEVPSPVVTEVVAEAEATREESSPASPLILVASRPPRGRPPAAPTQSLIQGLSLALIGFGLLLILAFGFGMAVVLTTTGVLLVAKNDAAHRSLAGQFAGRGSTSGARRRPRSGGGACRRARSAPGR